MKPIDNPKVFISYAWGTDAYQDKVMQFCSRLQGECGIEVIIDKCSLDAGNDTTDFMERCVKDPTVNFVIMLLDKNYAEKADARRGGVGTETQIISAKVYEDTEQTKFVPVVFERDANDKVYIPTYLVSRYHFDLTKENANDEFMRLVRHLHGFKTFILPPLGTRPDWVSQSTVLSPVVSGTLLTIGNTTDEALIRRETKKALKSIIESIFFISITNEETEQFKTDAQKYLEFLHTFRPYRDATITVFKQIVNKEYFEDIAADFFEEYKNRQTVVQQINNYMYQAISAMLHELFIYTIAVMWDAEEYSKIRGLITRTYITNGKYGGIETGTINGLVYSGDKTDLIDSAKNNVDNKKYHSGLAQLWTEHIMSGLSLELITFADLLVCNLHIIDEFERDWNWFPMLYIYATDNLIFKRFSIGLQSARHIIRLRGLFGDPSPEAIRKGLQKMVEKQSYDRYRYPNTFKSAPLIINYTSPEDVGKLP